MTIPEQFKPGLTALFPRTMAMLRNRGTDALVARHDARRAAIQKIYAGALGNALAHAQLEMLHKLHGSADATRRVGNRKVFNSTTPVAARFMFDLDAFKRMFFAEMADAAAQAIVVSALGMLSELGVDQDHVTDQGIIHDFTINRQNKLSGVPDEMYDAIKSELEDGIQDGDSIDDLADRVSAKFGDIEQGRAVTIAKTETASAYGTGRMDAMKQAGFEYKSWLTANDEKVRLSHNECQEQGPILLDDDFDNGLSYPGDPDGPPEEVINCRCVLQAAEKPDDDDGEDDAVKNRAQTGVKVLNGDLPGHPFHGNQWTDAELSDLRDKAFASSNAAKTRKDFKSSAELHRKVALAHLEASDQAAASGDTFKALHYAQMGMVHAQMRKNDGALARHFARVSSTVGDAAVQARVDASAAKLRKDLA